MNGGWLGWKGEGHGGDGRTRKGRDTEGGDFDDDDDDDDGGGDDDHRHLAGTQGDDEHADGAQSGWTSKCVPVYARRSGWR